ncbi:hypothetical protein NL676_004703 [Syzygium grande]|nr:hypothetical protein NL676_004703 [Syzygium grande]
MCAGWMMMEGNGGANSMEARREMVKQIKTIDGSNAWDDTLNSVKGGNTARAAAAEVSPPTFFLRCERKKPPPPPPGDRRSPTRALQQDSRQHSRRILISLSSINIILISDR